MYSPTGPLPTLSSQGISTVISLMPAVSRRVAKLGSKAKIRRRREAGNSVTIGSPKRSHARATDTGTEYATSCSEDQQFNPALLSNARKEVKNSSFLNKVSPLTEIVHMVAAPINGDIGNPIDRRKWTRITNF